jgi:hypothetical protein
MVQPGVGQKDLLPLLPSIGALKSCVSRAVEAQLPVGGDATSKLTQQVSRPLPVFTPPPIMADQLLDQARELVEGQIVSSICYSR